MQKQHVSRMCVLKYTVSRICAAVSLLRPRPKTKARFWTQKWGHKTKNSCGPNFGPMVYVCVLPSVKSALSCDRLHLSFMSSCAWCQDAGFTCRARSEGRQKACRPTAPRMGPRRSASQRNISKGAGMPVLFCSKHARLNFDCH